MTVLCQAIDTVYADTLRSTVRELCEEYPQCEEHFKNHLMPGSIMAWFYEEYDTEEANDFEYSEDEVRDVVDDLKDNHNNDRTDANTAILAMRTM